MNIGGVLEKADALYPNHYSIREKLGWCSDVSHTIRNEVNKRYDFVKTTADKLIDVIDSIGIDRVQSVMTRERVFHKTNVRSWYCDEKKILPEDVSGEVRVVYVIPAKPFRCAQYSGTLTVKNGFIVFDEPHSFEKGDTLIVEIPERTTAEVTAEEIGKSVKVSSDTIENYKGEAVVTKKLCDALECEPPYDYMYVDYLIGKMCFYQNDFDASNRHMAQYNNKIALYQRFVKSRDAYSNDVNFHGFWGRC